MSNGSMTYDNVAYMRDLEELTHLCRVVSCMDSMSCREQARVLRRESTSGSRCHAHWKGMPGKRHSAKI